MKKSFIFLLYVFLVCGFTFGQKMSTPVKIYNSPLHASKWGQVAFGPYGKVHVVWEEDYSDSGGSDIFYMSYDGVEWEGPVKVKNSRNIRAERPSVTTSQAGAVFVVWNQNGEVYMREYDPESETWLPDKRVATADYGADEPCCAVDPDGNIYIFWYTYDWGKSYSRARIDGKWEAIKRLSGGLRSTQGGIAAGKDGQVWAIFREKQGDGEYKTNYTKRTKDKEWAGSKQVNWGGASQTHPHVTVGSDNVPIATFADVDEHSGSVEVWICSIDEKTNPRELVVPNSFLHYSRIAVDSLGNKHVAWQIGPGDFGSGIKYRNNINKKAGQWNSSVLMQNSGGGPKLPGIAADDYGNVALVWASESSGSDKNIWFSSLYPLTTNRPPRVDAGTDQTVTFPDSAVLDGTVTDDGLPDPPAEVTTSWSKVSGPGVVTFVNSIEVDTTVSFSKPGTYVLRLTANDGELDGSNEVAITVLTGPPPVPEPPVNLSLDVLIKSLKRSPSITYNLNWENNPGNTEEAEKTYRIYKKENGGEFEQLLSLNSTIFSAVFSFETLNKKIQFGISTVYSFETGLYLTDESESEIVIFGNQ